MSSRSQGDSDEQKVVEAVGARAGPGTTAAQRETETEQANCRSSEAPSDDLWVAEMPSSRSRNLSGARAADLISARWDETYHVRHGRRVPPLLGLRTTPSPSTLNNLCVITEFATLWCSRHRSG